MAFRSRLLRASGFKGGRSLLNLLYFVHWQHGKTVERKVDAVDLFSGTATVVEAFCAAGRKAMGYDHILDPKFESITSGEGFMTALLYSLSIVVGGLAHFATVCSTWVFVSRSCKGRSKTMPYGTPDEAGMASDRIHQGNTRVSRMVLAFMMGSYGGETMKPKYLLTNNAPWLGQIKIKFRKVQSSTRPRL